MIKLFTLFLFFSFLTSATAQKDFRQGFIITSTDTLKGFIDYRGDKRNALLCVFKTNPKAAEQTFSPTQLTTYGFDSEKLYEAHLLPGSGKEKVFLNVLVKGHALRIPRFDLPRPFLLSHGRFPAGTEREFPV